MRKIIIIFIVSLVSVIMVHASTYSGKISGTNLTWTLNTSDSSFVVSGSGALTSLSQENFASWHSYRAFIVHVSLPDGLTKIGNYCFSSCPNLKTITIPINVTIIDSKAFKNTTLESIIWNAKNYPDCSSATEAPFYSMASAITSFVFGDQVRNIPAYICSSMSKLTSMTLPNTTTGIGSYAFQSCSSITSINVPNSVNNIGEGAFSGCSKLIAITIPDNITKVNKSILSGCSSLESVVIPGGVTSIEDYAFFNCKNLTSISIPNGVKNLGMNSFGGCSSLTNITIPSGVTVIKPYTFNGCRGLSSIIIPNGVTNIGDGAFQYCTNLTGIIIPNSVTGIEEDAFMGCYSLKTVEFGENIAQINIRAFRGCSNLEAVIWNIKNYPDFSNTQTPFYSTGDIYGSYKFDLRPQIKSFVFGDQVNSIPDYLCKGMAKLASIKIGKNVVKIGTFSFANCDSLQSIIWNAKSFPNCTSSSTPFYKKTNESSDFDSRSQITSFVFGEEVDTIPNYLCYSMKKINSIKIPNNVISVGDFTFGLCSGLRLVHIGTGVASIGTGAFNNCSGLKSVYTDNLTAWCKISFKQSSSNPLCYARHLCMNDSEITDLVIPEGVSEIKKYAFYNCASFTSISIPNSVIGIGGAAFYGNSNLPSITIPKNVTNIGIDAFKECSGLKSVIWNAKNYPDCSSTNTPFYYSDNTSSFDLRPQITSFVFGNDVESIPNFLCCGMANLPSVTIGKNVMKIGNETFSGCSGLGAVVWNAMNYPNCSSMETPFFYSYKDISNITRVRFDLRSQISSFAFGEDVDTIPNYLCANMTSLGQVDISNNVARVGVRAFSGCVTLTSISLGDNIVSIGDNAFSGCSGLTSVTIGNRLTSVGTSAFQNCNALTAVHINSIAAWCGVTFSDYSWEANPLYYAQHLYLNDERIKDLIIPEGVTEIKKLVFLKCSDLTSISIPSSVTKIEYGAFAYCTSDNTSTWVVNNSPTPQKINEGVFNGLHLNNPPTLFVPKNSIADYKVADVWKYFNIEAIADAETLSEMINSATTYYNVIKDDYPDISDGLLVAIQAAQSIVSNTNATLSQLSHANSELNAAIQTAKLEVATSQLEANIASFDTYKSFANNSCANLVEDGDSEACLQLIADAQAAIAALTYDENKSLEENEAIIDAIVEKLQNDLQIQREKDRSEDIEQINRDSISNCLKLLYDGRIYILRGDKTYTITGQEVR